MARAFREELTMAVRVIEPQTRDDVRRSNLAAANAAMLKGNAAVAVKHYSEMLRLSSDLAASLSLENDVVISRAFVSKDQFENRKTPFLMNVRREAVPV